MAENKVQFQQGFSLTRFLSQNRSKEQCRSALFKMRWPHVFVCPQRANAGDCRFSVAKFSSATVAIPRPR